LIAYRSKTIIVAANDNYIEDYRLAA